MATQLKFTMLYQDKPQDFWYNFFWANKTKCTAPHLIMMIGDDNLGLFWSLAVTELTMNFSVYKSILELNVKPSVRQLKLGQNYVMQQDTVECQQI